MSLKSILVKTPQFPKVIDDFKSSPAKPIRVGKGLGNIREFKLALTKDELPRSLQGIAIQRGGMTVTRYVPDDMPLDFRPYVYGYCFSDDTLDEELYTIELANHEGFETRRRAWVELRRRIDEQTETFLEPHIKRPKLPSVKMDFSQIIKTINKLVEDHLEGFGDAGRGKKKKPGVGGILNLVRLSPWGYKGDDRRFELDSILEHNAGVINDTSQVKTIRVRRWIEGATGKYLMYRTEKFKVSPESGVLVNLPDIDFSTAGLGRGKYSLMGMLEDSGGRSLFKRPRSSVFYLDMPPPPTGGWLRKIHLIPEGGPNKKRRNRPFNNKTGELIINQLYPEFEKIFSLSVSATEKRHRTGRYIVNTALSEAVKEAMLDWYGSDGEEFDIKQIKQGKILFDSMWADYIEQYGVT